MIFLGKLMIEMRVYRKCPEALDGENHKLDTDTHDYCASAICAFLCST